MAGRSNDPILVLAEGRDRYLGEILKAEGFNEFRLEVPAWLREHTIEADVVILGEAALDAGQASVLRSYVKAGGNLIAIRPCEALHDVFGIAGAGSEDCRGRLTVGENPFAGSGFACCPLLLHAASACYETLGASTVAELQSSGGDARLPAVVWHEYGEGRSAAFSYNLAENIMLTRQGNPALAGRETDGINGIRAMDLFTGGWVDPEALHVNAADEQMRLLSRLIGRMSAAKKPLPRLWYFPEARMSHVVLTNDSEYSSGEEIGEELSLVREKGATMTVYLLDTSRVTKEQTDAWVKAGHEVAAHPGLLDHSAHNAYANNPAWEQALETVRGKVEEVERLYGHGTNTCANHWFVWCGTDEAGSPDFSAMARIYEACGIGMDCNYAVYDNGAGEGPFLGGTKRPGNFTGSGLPMRMADASGGVLDVYQLVNNAYDQQYEENADPDGFLRCFRTLLDRSLEGAAYSWVHVKAHRSMWGFSSQAVLKMLDYARAKGIPATTAEQCLSFMRMKDGARICDIEWDGGRLSFTLDSATDAGMGLTLLLPASYGGGALGQVSLDGIASQADVRTVMGEHYAFLTVRGGRRSRIEAAYAGMA